MKHPFLLALGLVVITTFICQGQTDTIFYNTDWKETTRKDSISFYRIITPSNGLFAVSDYYASNILQMSGTYSSIKPDKKEGLFKYYNKDGALTTECNYSNDMLEGKYKHYYSSGRVWYEATYKENQPANDFLYYYDEDGSILKRKEIYKKTKLKKGYCYTREGKDTTYFPYQVMPEFKGGTEALMKYLSKNLIYPADARKYEIEGRIVIKFIITTEGNIDSIEVIKRRYPSLDDEAIRVVKAMPKWKPGLLEGVPVNVTFNLPVSFKLN